MKDKIGCIFGLHNYEIIEELSNTDKDYKLLQKFYISRCKNCGKITHYVVNIQKESSTVQY